jgi:hypothetical protein
VTEPGDDDALHLMTHIETTAGPGADGKDTPIHIKLTDSSEAPVALWGSHTPHDALTRSLPSDDHTTGGPCSARDFDYDGR